MRAQVIAIGNSRGIRIPKSLLIQTGITGEVELEARDGGVFIRPVQAKPHPRAGWAEQIRKAGPEPIDAETRAWIDMPSAFDSSGEWQWEE